MDLLIKLAIPEPGKSQPEEEMSLEEEVRESIKLAESDTASTIEWKALRQLYKHLCKQKQTPEIRNVRKLLKPVLSKYGYHVE